LLSFTPSNFWMLLILVSNDNRVSISGGGSNV
jgi:hypothetical protein